MFGEAEHITKTLVIFVLMLMFDVLCLSVRQVMCGGCLCIADRYK